MGWFTVLKIEAYKYNYILSNNENEYLCFYQERFY